MSVELRAEFFYDDEAGSWHFRVPALHLNGGGAVDRMEAERLCVAAVAFALEGDPTEFDQTAEAVALDVEVAARAAA